MLWLEGSVVLSVPSEASGQAIIWGHVEVGLLWISSV